MLANGFMFSSTIFFVSAAVNSETHEQVAIKKIGNAFDNIVDAKRTLREIKLLRHMEHENVSAHLCVLLQSEYMVFQIHNIFLVILKHLCQCVIFFLHISS